MQPWRLAFPLASHLAWLMQRQQGSVRPNQALATLRASVQCFQLLALVQLALPPASHLALLQAWLRAFQLPRRRSALRSIRSSSSPLGIQWWKMRS